MELGTVHATQLGLSEQLRVVAELANSNWWRLARHLCRVRQLRRLWGHLGGRLKRYSELPAWK